MSVLEVTNLTFSFGNKIILEDANFVMQKGEHIGLIGMNGEGKSTFIKLITHQISPDEGKIVWAKNLTTGYLDQYLTLTKGKTIKEAKLYIENVSNMLNDLEYDKEIIKEAIVYENTKNTSRKTCAFLPYEGIKKIIDKI